MAKQKSDADWLAIFESFAQSGLPANQFCKQFGLSTSSFYAKRRDLKNKIAPSVSSNFLPVEMVDDRLPISEPSSSTLIIHVKNASLSLPANTDASYVLALLKGLS